MWLTVRFHLVPRYGIRAVRFLLLYTLPRGGRCTHSSIYLYVWQCFVGCAVDWRLGYGLDGPGFEFLRGQEIVLFSKISRPAVGTTQPPIQCVSGGSFPGVKQPRLEVYRSPYLVPKLRMNGAIPPLLYVFLAQTGKLLSLPFYS
jgi:hypothetical protein